MLMPISTIKRATRYHRVALKHENGFSHFQYMLLTRIVSMLTRRKQILHNLTSPPTFIADFLLLSLVNVAFDKHSFLGFFRLSLTSVFSKLSKRVGFCPDEQDLLSSFYILSSASPSLQASVLKGFAYENDTCHGFGAWFIALKFKVASTSDCPPDKN